MEKGQISAKDKKSKHEFCRKDAERIHEFRENTVEW